MTAACDGEGDPLVLGGEALVGDDELLQAARATAAARAPNRTSFHTTFIIASRACGARITSLDGDLDELAEIEAAHGKDAHDRRSGTALAFVRI
ncbi:MAG: hypothetical protein ACR2KK_21685 [Acidimicrobiales bacterium]